MGMACGGNYGVMAKMSAIFAGKCGRRRGDFGNLQDLTNFVAMKKNLYIFNPENDLALAFGEEGYTAPPAARQLRRDLQMLPAWFCGAGAVILSQDCDTDSLWLGEMSRRFGIDAVCMPLNHLQNHRFEYRPWGWNLDLRRRLIGACVPAGQLPTVEHIMTLRQLSHRSISVKIHDFVRARIGGYPFPECPVEVFSVEDVRAYERRHSKCFVKAPWSSSGHGVYRVLEPESRNFEIWTQGIINRQGSLLCEEALDVIQDFAMEFLCHGGNVEFVGYSVFDNDMHCSFDSGIVASCEHLRRIIATKLGDADLLERVRQVLMQFVDIEIAPHYDGYLGVDMMLYGDDCGVVRINPCVELNLRMTMGALTAIFGERFLADGAVGRFRVVQSKQHSVEELMRQHSSEAPAVVVDGRLQSGFMPLVPVYKGSRYCAYIEV